jgi:hypothetical protein
VRIHDLHVEWWPIDAELQEFFTERLDGALGLCAVFSHPANIAVTPSPSLCISYSLKSRGSQLYTVTRNYGCRAGSGVETELKTAKRGLQKIAFRQHLLVWCSEAFKKYREIWFGIEWCVITFQIGQ